MTRIARLLLICDEPRVRSLVVQLDRLFENSATIDTRTADDAVAGRDYDAILLDATTGSHDRGAIARRLRIRNPSTPVIVIGRTDVASIAALGDGADAFVLPTELDRLPSIVASAKASRGFQSLGTGHAARVLLVEDEIAVAEGIATILEMEGYLVHIVHSGTDAVTALATFGPDLIILDIALPDIDGFDLYESLVDRLRNVPVIFSTGHGNASRLDTIPSAGRTRFLQKPYSSDTLLTTMHEVLKKGEE